MLRKSFIALGIVGAFSSGRIYERGQQPVALPRILIVEPYFRNSLENSLEGGVRSDSGFRTVPYNCREGPINLNSPSNGLYFPGDTLPDLSGNNLKYYILQDGKVNIDLIDLSDTL